MNIDLLTLVRLSLVEHLKQPHYTTKIKIKFRGTLLINSNFRLIRIIRCIVLFIYVLMFLYNWNDLMERKPGGAGQIKL